MLAILRVGRQARAYQIETTMFRSYKSPWVNTPTQEGSNKFRDKSPQHDEASQANPEVFVQIRSGQNHEKRDDRQLCEHQCRNVQQLVCILGLEGISIK